MSTLFSSNYQKKLNNMTKIQNNKFNSTFCLTFVNKSPAHTEIDVFKNHISCIKPASYEFGTIKHYLHLKDEWKRLNSLKFRIEKRHERSLNNRLSSIHETLNKYHNFFPFLMSPRLRLKACY